MPEPVNIITAEKVQHWADCANLTAKRESIIHAETLAAIARQLQTQNAVKDAQHKVIAELEKSLVAAETRGDMYSEIVIKFCKVIPKEVNEDNATSMMTSAMASD